MQPEVTIPGKLVLHPAWLVFAALDEPWAVRQWKICSRDPKSLPAPARLLLDHLSARPQPRELGRLRPRPDTAPLVARAPVRSPALDTLVHTR